MATSKPGSGLNPSIIARLREIIKLDDLSTWEQAWQEKVTPWDEGHIQPALREAVEKSGFDLPRSGRALVPGCGVGYDAIFLANALGLDTLGIEISATAIKEATNYLASLETPPSAKVSYSKTDFFEFTIPDNEKFDLIYDYTFFSAIPPTRRLEWGQKIASLIKPGGYLIALAFPILPETNVGPPYFLRPEHYDEPLGNNFKKLLEKIPEESSPIHVGKEKLLIWKRV